MTVPSREEVAREAARWRHITFHEARLGPWDKRSETWRIYEAWLEARVLDALARVGHPVLMGYDHPHCLYCRGTGRMPIGTMGRTEPCDHPGDKGRPVYWEAP